MKDISLVRILPQEPRVPFISARMIAGALSVMAIIASIILFSVRGLNYGIDFTGGTVLEIGSITQELDDAQIRSAIAELGYAGATVQGIQPPVGAETADGVPITNRLVRIGLQLQDESGEDGQGAQQAALNAVKEGLTDKIGEYFVRIQKSSGRKSLENCARKAFYLWQWRC